MAALAVVVAVLALLIIIMYVAFLSRIILVGFKKPFACKCCEQVLTEA